MHHVLDFVFLCAAFTVKSHREESAWTQFDRQTKEQICLKYEVVMIKMCVNLKYLYFGRYHEFGLEWFFFFHTHRYTERPSSLLFHCCFIEILSGWWRYCAILAGDRKRPPVWTGVSQKILQPYLRPCNSLKNHKYWAAFQLLCFCK